MKKTKVVTSLFFSPQGVYYKGKLITPSNISTIPLKKILSSPIADVYARNNKRKPPYIIHVKDPEAFAKGNPYLEEKLPASPHVDWDEDPIEETIEYLVEKCMVRKIS